MPTPYNLDIHNNCTDCPVRESRPFCNMAPAAVAAMNQLKFTSVYSKGSILYAEGEQSRGVYLVCSGKVKLTTSSTEGRTLIVRIVEAGEMIGAGAAILDTPHEVSAETLEPSQLNFIRRDDFLKFLNTYPEACMHAAQQLSETYHDAQREIRSLGLSQTTAEKLARVLLDWCARAETTAAGIRLKILLTHEEIAQMIGTTRETVTRVLSDLKARKIIEVKGSTLLVLQKDQLQAMCSI
jgi:CRP/FNR family transcriptional regulator